MVNWHADFIEVLVRQLRPKVYVELGICGAVTLNRSLPFVGEAYACDMHPFDKFLTSNPAHLYKFLMTTSDFADVWNKEIKKPIDFIFIDADHSKESVAKDIENFLPWLVENTGIMLLHDMWPPDKAYATKEHCGDSYLLNSMLRNMTNIEYTVIPTQFGIGVIRKPTLDWRN